MGTTILVTSRYFCHQLEKSQLMLSLSPRLVHTYVNQGPTEHRWYAGLASDSKAKVKLWSDVCSAKTSSHLGVPKTGSCL